jgi:hypothetical protein
MPGLYLAMTYRRCLPTAHTCVHCHESYQAVDRCRLYCSSSYRVQVCEAKRRALLAAQAANLAIPRSLGKLPLAEFDPYQAPQLGYGYQLNPFQMPPAPRPGSMLQDLG